MKQSSRSTGLLSAMVLGLMFLFIAGCGGSSSENNSGTSSTVVSGTASKGPIEGGTVNVVALNSDGSQGALLGATTTNADGSYSISLGSYTGSVLAIVTGGTYTDEATNTVVTNTATFRAAVTDATGSVIASITPLTELAVQNAGTLTTANITAANNQVSTILGGVNILTTKPADMAGSVSGYSQAEKDYGLMLAALSQMANTSGKSVADVVSDIKNDLSDGKLDTTGADLTTSLATFLASTNNHSDMTAGDTNIVDSIAALITGVTAAPAQVTVTAGDGSVTLSWNTVTGATSYNVYLGASTGVSTLNGTKKAGATSPYTISSLENGFKYYFVVTAVNANGESAISAEVNATPTAVADTTLPTVPSGLNAVPASSSQINLSWTASTDNIGVMGYRVYKGGTLLKTVIAISTTSDTGLAADTNYCYTVSAIDAAGNESAQSTQVCATTSAAVAPAPTITSFTPASGAAGTTTVIITGTNFSTQQTLNTVSFNGVQATVGEASATQLWVTVPATATSGPITVTVGGQTATSATDFTVSGGTPAPIAGLMGGSIQSAPLNLTTVVTTFAGVSGSKGTTDGTGTAARFNQPQGITTDGTYLYVTDTTNNTVRKIVISSGVVTTLAGSAAGFNTPSGITTDGTNLYVVDRYNSKIRKIVISSGVVTTLAGSGTNGSTDGTGTAASFYYPVGITTDGTNLYVTDSMNSTIRKIDMSTGDVTTLAGTARINGYADGTGSAASFDYPAGITTDGTNLYVVDSNKHTIRMIVISSGVVTTLAGTARINGSTDATGAAARFKFPQGITTDGTNLYVTDSGNYTIRKIVISSGVVTTLAGTAGLLASGAGDGTGAAARFGPSPDLTTDGTNLYVVDGDAIRKIQ